MFDLNSNNVKIATKIVTTATIIVLVAACSSKQVINEASIQDQQSAELTDTAADQNPYVDQSELPTREQEERKVVKKRTAHKKKSRKHVAAHKQVKPVEHKQEEIVKQEEAALPAIGSVENQQSPPMPPPPPTALGESEYDQAMLEESTSLDFSGLILENWFYILALIGLGAGGYYGFKFYQKRGTSKRKSKRRLVFN